MVYLGKGIYRTSECGLDRLECKRADISALFFCELHGAERHTKRLTSITIQLLYTSRMVIVVGNAEPRKNIHLSIDKIHII